MIGRAQLPHNQLAVFALHIASGMAYLSSRRFVHRDLACRNVLVDTVCRAKVANFGLSRDIYDHAYYASTNASTRLPLRWMSPEVFLSQKFGEASDVWAYGVTLVELYSQATTPYGEWSNILVLERVKDGCVLPRPADCPVAIYNEVIAPCFLKKPRERPSFQALCTRLSAGFGLGAMVQLESSLASPLAMLPPENAGVGVGVGVGVGGGGGRAGRSASADSSPSEEGRANSVVTDGASFGFECWDGPSAKSFAASSGIDTPQTDVAVWRSTSALDAGLCQSGDAVGVACLDGLYPHGGGSAAACSHNRHRYRRGYRLQASMGPPPPQKLYPPEPGGCPTLTASVVIERTDELQEGQPVTPLEAQMFRALQRMEAHDAHDHLLKIRRLTDAQLATTVTIDGVPWLATEVDLLRKLPEGSRSAFRQRAHDRAKRLLNAELAQAETHPEPLFVNSRRAGDPGALSHLSSSDAERVYGVLLL